MSKKAKKTLETLHAELAGLRQETEHRRGLEAQRCLTLEAEAAALRTREAQLTTSQGGLQAEIDALKNALTVLRHDEQQWRTREAELNTSCGRLQAEIDA